MQKRDELTDPTSCLSRAHDDEHVFVLRERDPAWSGTVDRWVELRVELGKNQPGDDQVVQLRGMTDQVERARRDARLRPGVLAPGPRLASPDEDRLAQLRDLALRLADGDAPAAELLLLCARTTLHHDACVRDGRPL